jgi:colanic acid biosynthesis glycosyl transferase WcaI
MALREGSELKRFFRARMKLNYAGNISHLTQRAAGADLLGSANISLVTLNRHLGQLNVPSKTYSIMASGRPVLASVPDDSEIARLIKDADCGVLVPPEDPQSLAHAIQGLSNQPELLDRYGSNGRRYVAAHFSRRILTRRYHELLHQVTSERK